MMNSMLNMNMPQAQQPQVFNLNSTQNLTSELRKQEAKKYIQSAMNSTQINSGNMF